MTCPDCRGRGYISVNVRIFIAENARVGVVSQLRPCQGCGGSGIAHCCDGPVGCAGDVTNTGEAAD